jgi:uncharacterized protein with NRDE domain
MCLIAFALNSHLEYSLVMGANRDEFYDRPTEHAHWWNDERPILSGRDLMKGGTWLGVTSSGRIAAVTNYRDGYSLKANASSRGLLVTDYLKGSEKPEAYLAKIKSTADLYDGFNLIVYDSDALYYYSNRREGITKVAPGVHALSNHLLDTPWPKLVRSKQALAASLESKSADLKNALFALLADDARADDDELPDTGITKEWEKQLSSPFIALDDYGTRSSTVVLLRRDGRIFFEERNFGRGGQRGEIVRDEFQRSG